MLLPSSVASRAHPPESGRALNAATVKRVAAVVLGTQAWPLGQLTYARDGRRVYSAFGYRTDWLQAREAFEHDAAYAARALLG